MSDVATVRGILFDIAGEFATSDPDGLARVDRFIGYAESEVSRATYTNPDMAIALLTAHKLTLAARGGAAIQGAIVKEKVGEIERAYAAPQKRTSSLGNNYDATAYGAEFAALTGAGRRRTPFVL